MSISSSCSSRDIISSSSSPTTYTYGKEPRAGRREGPYSKSDKPQTSAGALPSSLLRDIIDSTRLMHEIDKKMPDLGTVSKLVKCSPEQIECADFFAQTPLSVALRRGHSKIVNLLINRGGFHLTHSVKEHLPPPLGLKLMAGYPACISSVREYLASGEDPLIEFGGDTALETAFRSHSAVLCRLFQTPILIDRWITLRRDQVSISFFQTLMNCPTDIFLKIIPKLIDQVAKSEQEQFAKLPKTHVSQGMRFRLCRHLMKNLRMQQIKSPLFKNPLSMPLQLRKLEISEIPSLKKTINRWHDIFSFLFDTSFNEWTSVYNVPSSVTSALISQLNDCLKGYTMFNVDNGEDTLWVKLEDLTICYLEQIERQVNPTCLAALNSHPLLFFSKQLSICRRVFFEGVRRELESTESPVANGTWIVENRTREVQGIVQYHGGEIVNLVTAPWNLGNGLLKSFCGQKTATGVGTLCIEECLQLALDDELPSIRLKSSEISIDFYTRLGFKIINSDAPPLMELSSKEFVQTLFNFGGYAGIEFA